MTDSLSAAPAQLPDALRAKGLTKDGFFHLCFMCGDEAAAVFNVPLVNVRDSFATSLSEAVVALVMGPRLPDCCQITAVQFERLSEPDEFLFGLWVEALAAVVAMEHRHTITVVGEGLTCTCGCLNGWGVTPRRIQKETALR